MRKAVAEATHHAAHWFVFGPLLIDQPLMRNVLADLCLESEAAATLAIRQPEDGKRPGYLLILDVNLAIHRKTTGRVDSPSRRRTWRVSEMDVPCVIPNNYRR